MSVMRLEITAKKRTYPFGQIIHALIFPAEDNQARHKPISVILKRFHK